jgi:hypothetical protein
MFGVGDAVRPIDSGDVAVILKIIREAIGITGALAGRVITLGARFSF